MVTLGLHHNNVNLLRAAAVLAVFAHHFQHYTGVNVPYLGTFGGQFGVQLFFLISGYLIVQSAARQRWWAFLINRAFRIFPAFWAATLIGSLWIHHVLPLADSADWPYFLANLLTLSHFVPYASGRFDVLAVSWTLTIEWTWYLLAPLLIWGANMVARRGVAGLHYWCAVFFVSLVVSVSWVMQAQNGTFDAWYAPSVARLGVSPLSDPLRTAFIVVAAPAQLVFFMLGVLLWVGRQPLSCLPSWVYVVVVAVMLTQPVWWSRFLGVDPNIATGLGLAGLFMLITRCPAACSRSVPGRLAHWVGDLSYPFYLIHVPVIMLVSEQLKAGELSVLIASVTTTLIAALLLHHGVEDPGRRLGAWTLSPRMMSSV